MNFKDLQTKNKAWLQHNFPNNTPEQAALGLAEEVGELCHAILKISQGIRGDFDLHISEAKDAIGDITIFATSLCNIMKLDYNEIVTETANQVFSRVWVKYPFDGKTR